MPGVLVINSNRKVKQNSGNHDITVVKLGNDGGNTSISLKRSAMVENCEKYSKLHYYNNKRNPSDQHKSPVNRTLC